MARSQAGKAAGSARLGNDAQAARKASCTTSSARWKSPTIASAEPKANCWKRRVSSTKAATSR
jgi:hypothetical protein